MQIVRERRKAETTAFQKKLFLRKEKSAIVALKMKKLEKNKSATLQVSKHQKTSFKSNLEKLHKRDQNIKM